MNVKKLLGIKDIRDVSSVMCIQPHPDDNEIGAGATLALLAARGVNIIFVTVTDGRYGNNDPSITPEQMIAIRRAEKNEAGELLGVQKHYDLGYEDGGEYSEREVARSLVPLIRKEKPEMVMTVDPWTLYEAHPDHYKVGRATSEALLAVGRVGSPEAGEPHHVRQVAYYASGFPNAFIEVTAYWEIKMQAILKHKSQFDNEEWPLLSQYFTYQAGEYFKQLGLEKQRGLAEAFKVLSPRQLHVFPTAWQC